MCSLVFVSLAGMACVYAADHHIRTDDVHGAAEIITTADGRAADPFVI